MATSRVRDCVNAAVDALKTDSSLITLLGGAKAYTHVPQNTDPPYTMVIGGDEVPWVVTLEQSIFGSSPVTTDGGDNGGRQVDVLVQCVSTFRGSAQVDSIAALVMEILTTPSTWASVMGFQLAEFVRNAVIPPSDLNADGVMWFQRLVTVRVSLV